MPAEDQNREEANLEATNGNHSFDELAKGLATGSFSRSQALRWMGAALLGGVLANAIPGLAFATHKGTPHGGDGGGGGGGGGTPPSESPPTGSQGCRNVGEIRVGGKCQCPSSAPELCGGVCREACPGAKVFNSSCQCVCPPATCTFPKVQNPNTCACECPTSVTCTTPKVRDPNTCACECPTSITCTSPKVLNPSTCACECTITCPSPQVLNTTHCFCECPTLGSFPCGQICCPSSTPSGRCGCGFTGEDGSERACISTGNLSDYACAPDCAGCPQGMLCGPRDSGICGSQRICYTPCRQ